MPTLMILTIDFAAFIIFSVIVLLIIACFLLAQHVAQEYAKFIHLTVQHLRLIETYM